MANSYRLGDADRARFGAPEWMPLELMDVTLDQVTDLSERFGFEIEDWPEAFFGKVGEDGERKSPRWQIQTAVWLALHQSGINVPYENVGQIAVLRVQWRKEEEPGKDEGSSDSPPSPTPETSTTPPSSTSSPDSAEQS